MDREETIMEKMLTVQEVATMFSLHENTVRAWIRDGLLPSYNLGPRLVRIKESDLEKLFSKVYPETEQ